LVIQVSQKIIANDPKAAHTPTPPQRIDSSELLAGGKRVIIEHQGVPYLLQVTRSGKLILTKLIFIPGTRGQAATVIHPLAS
jgi:hemin uptake protein HemP